MHTREPVRFIVRQGEIDGHRGRPLGPAQYPADAEGRGGDPDLAEARLAAPVLRHQQQTAPAPRCARVLRLRAEARARAIRRLGQRLAGYGAGLDRLDDDGADSVRPPGPQADLAGHVAGAEQIVGGRAGPGELHPPDDQQEGAVARCAGGEQQLAGLEPAHRRIVHTPALDYPIGPSIPL